jgi:aspartate racemase
MRSNLSVGVVGGMSPESTITYYQHIIRRHQAEFGDHSYPRIIIASVSFQQYIEWQHQEDWNRIADELAQEFTALSSAGADFAVLATNTMHKILPQIDSPIPVLNVLDAVSRFARAKSIKSVGLTGTRFTMSDGFYAEELEKRGLRVVIPDAGEQKTIHNIIYDELISGNVSPLSQNKFIDIAKNLITRGAEAVLLGCTELELLVRQNSAQVNFIDSTKVHVDLAWEISVGKSSLLI